MSKSSRRERILRRNKKVRARFNEFVGKKHFSVDHALELLAEEHALTTGTLWLIVSRTGHYKE